MRDIADLMRQFEQAYARVRGDGGTWGTVDKDMGETAAEIAAWIGTNRLPADDASIETRVLWVLGRWLVSPAVDAYERKHGVRCLPYVGEADGLLTDVQRRNWSALCEVVERVLDGATVDAACALMDERHGMSPGFFRARYYSKEYRADLAEYEALLKAEGEQ
ncbi:hypothetical protein AB4Y35_07360 [Paraburkholderia sp. EG286A]|uniref:hypothetical protein n=1 Tax=Paraburkholderia sp. EG286A TaxID=3237014 RepID=UPI0034D2D851